MDGNEMANNYKGPNIDHGRRVRTGSQSTVGTDEYGASRCVSCAAGLPRRSPAAELKERLWQWGIVGLSVGGLLGTAVAFVAHIMGG